MVTRRGWKSPAKRMAAFIAVLAIGVGLVLYNRNDKTEQKEAAQIRRFGGMEHRAVREPGKPIYIADFSDFGTLTDNGLGQLAETLEGLSRLRIFDVSGCRGITDSGLVYLERFTQVDAIYLGKTKVTDAGLVHLKPLTQLRTLNLRATAITDVGFANVRELVQLQELELGNTGITDAGLANIQGMTQLEQLELSNTKITDAGIRYLKRLTRLKMLRIDNTKVTDAGARELQQALPNCTIAR